MALLLIHGNRRNAASLLTHPPNRQPAPMQTTSQLDTTVEIVTPENISFRYEVAGPFRRVPAFLMDMGIRGATLTMVALLSMLLGVMTRIGANISMGFILVVWFLLEWFYGALFETYMNGQTPGKRLMGIRVVSVDGFPVHGIQATMRNILRGVDMMPLFPLAALDEAYSTHSIPTLGVAVLFQLTSPRFQRLGDLVCGTMVVTDERREATICQLRPEPRVAALADAIPSGFRMTNRLYRAIAAYVDRRMRVSASRRHEIARYIAEPLMERWELPAETSYDLLLCALHWKFSVSRMAQSRESPSASWSMPPIASPTSEPTDGGTPTIPSRQPPSGMAVRSTID